jgi:hypothetical protein
MNSIVYWPKLILHTLTSFEQTQNAVGEISESIPSREDTYIGRILPDIEADERNKSGRIRAA